MKDSNRLDFTSSSEVNRATVGRDTASRSSVPLIYLRERLQTRAIVPRTATAVAILSILLSISTSLAGSATWKGNPTSGDWNTATNWTPQTVPNAVDAIATFQSSNVTSISTSAVTNVGGIVFGTNASPFTITPGHDFLINGSGITNNSGITQQFVSTYPAVISFLNSASFVGRISFTVDGGSKVQFNDTATAAGAILIANGGSAGGKGGLIDFRGHSQGYYALTKLFGNGTLAIDQHAAGTVVIASLEGNGIVVLGANRLNVGTNGLSTTFSGRIKDGPTGAGGSLMKSGRILLTLTNANTYTGGTIIKQGQFFANNSTGSATGSGPVQVNGYGYLRGDGTIAGPVTISGGLVPGSAGVMPGHLTINNTLTFDPYSDYFVYSDTTGTLSKVTANGVTINGNVQFDTLLSGTPAKGTVVTIIDNISANPIFGTFSNLPDGSTYGFSSGTSFKVNYQGGNGNDLTLTVQ